METASEGIFINRELSWLAFDTRVLELAKDKSVPLAEQLNFAGIFASNLDEFFMIRVGSLFDQTLLKEEKCENKTNMTPTAQLHAIMAQVRNDQEKCDHILSKLFAHLTLYGYERADFSKMSKEEEHRWKKYFTDELYPVLSPQIIDRRHPFPFLRNLDVYVGARFKVKNGNAETLGIIPISNQYDRIIYYKGKSGKTHFAFVEDIVLHFAEQAFGKYTLLDKGLFRVTRNADINVEEGMLDHDIDYREVMRELLKKRRKLAAVRLQVSHKTSQELVDMLCQKLLLEERNCFFQSAPLDMSFVRPLCNHLAKDNLSQLFYLPRRPALPGAGFRLAEAVQQQDQLLCFPYQSIRPFVEMLWDAANDPSVISIKMTLYRVATESKIIEALIRAAENGKEVVTIVELRARFDEQNNIDWSKQLENAGCTVIYGFEDYKVHSKLTLITRKVKDQYKYIAQIGTGNYNEKTAELYADYSFLTTNQELAEEVATVFHDLAVEHKTEQTHRLLVAPYCFKSVLLREIAEEIAAKGRGEPASIIIKCNSVSDKELIEALSQASIAEVPVEMIVRGICCLKAGIPGKTDHITVRSIVGRYLEHGRIYSFGTGSRQRIYIASGDFLTRNTERRVEVGVRIDAPEIKQTLNDILKLQLADNCSCRIMQPDGSYKKNTHKEYEPAVDSQMEMYRYLADAWQEVIPSVTEPRELRIPKTGLLGKMRKLLRRSK